MLLAALLSAAIGVVAVSIFQAVFKLMEDITKLTELSPEVIVPVVKAVAIAVCTKITAELCRDAKETAVASSVELVGASAGVYVVLPLVTSVLSLVASLL